MIPGDELGRPRQDGPTTSATTTQHGTPPGDIAVGDEVTVTSDPTATVVPRSDAQRRCQQIQLLLESMTRQKEKILFLVTEAKEHDDHLVLGYPSWPAYVSAEFAAALTELTRDDRRWFAFALSETGMSSRAIAPIVGVTDRQVRLDVAQLAQVGNDFPPDREDHLGEDLEDHLGEDLDGRLDNALTEPSKITATTPTKRRRGLDGKSYPAPKPAPKPKPRRASFPDAYRYAVDDLDKVVRRLEKLHADDRFLGHREDLRHREGLLTEIAWVVSEIESDLCGHLKCPDCEQRVVPDRFWREALCIECREVRDVR